MTNNYFSFAEMILTNTGLPNIPNWEQIQNLQALVVNVLNPAREAYKKPIYVTSGYRSHEVNAAIGGARNSQHTRGFASDVTTGSKEGNKALFQILLRGPIFDQLIDEKDFSWIHVSYRKGNNRLEVLKL